MPLAPLRARRVALQVVALLATLAAPVPAQQAFTIPIDYYKLPNGLKVVLSRDTAAPTVVVGVYYNIGFRIEPRDRTGFAHLFEHLMFQGSANLGKGEFIGLVQSNGGVLNGSTRFDFTNYYQVVPSHTLEPILWAEADRMGSLVIDSVRLRNQQDVVMNEVKVNVINQPYGGFPWLDMPQVANTNWFNAHNFYGDLGDLEAATLDDVRSFFRTYYAPNNAVLVVVGAFDPARTKQWITKYFGSIPAATLPVPADITEPRQEEERWKTREAPLATRPALGVAYHVPPRYSPEWFAFGLIDQVLGQGRDAWFYDELVRKRALTGGVNAGINFGLGNMYNYHGPMLWIVSAFHDDGTPSDSLIAGVDAAIKRLRDAPLDAATLDRARLKQRSAFYSMLEALSGFGRADLLASFALFDDDPNRINTLEAGFAAVTPAMVQKTAQEYLRPTNRSVLTLTPGRKETSSR